MNAIFPLMTHGPAYWTGGHNVGNNDTFVWAGTGNVLPDNASLWRYQPEGCTHGCVMLLKDRFLADASCWYPFHFICEQGQGFYIENCHGKDWADAEAACQEYGSHVHLATIDTQQVSILISSSKNIRFPFVTSHKVLVFLDTTRLSV